MGARLSRPHAPASQAAHGMIMDVDKESGAEAPVRRIPSYIKRRRSSVSAETGQSACSTSLPCMPKPAPVAARLRAIIDDVAVFNELDEEQRSVLVAAMAERRVRPEEVVICEGDEGDFFYVVDNGRFQAAKAGHPKFTYDGTGSFGEIALLYNTPRTATVVSETEGLLWALDRSSFRALVVGGMKSRRIKHEAVLRNTPLFSDLSDAQLAAIADCLAPHDFPAGTNIITMGEPITSASKFYIVVEGRVDCFRSTSAGGRKLTRTVGPGDVFGEVALVAKLPRQADCIATSGVKCLAMSRDAFERLMGPVEQTLAKQIEVYAGMNDKE